MIPFKYGHAENYTFKQHIHHYLERKKEICEPKLHHCKFLGSAARESFLTVFARFDHVNYLLSEEKFECLQTTETRISDKRPF